jgi:hypothetical protein
MDGRRIIGGDIIRRRLVVPDGDDDYGILVHEFAKNKNKTIRIHVQEFRGSEFLSLREFYRDKESGELKPSPKGFTIKPELYAELLHGVIAAGEALGFDGPEGLDGDD